MQEFPANSRKAQTAQEPKKVERVVSGDARLRKKPLGKQFKETFLGGDARTALHYVVFNVLIPSAKNMLSEAASSGIDSLIYGETRRTRSTAPPAHGPTGYVSYNRSSHPMSQPVATAPPPARRMSNRARSMHDFDEIVLPTRVDAEEVIDRLFDIVSRYESASVADLYVLTGLPSTHADHSWGWTDLRGATVGSLRGGGGYLLILPDPQPL